MSLRRLFWVVPAIVLAAGCGKKGPPLAPMLRIPAAITVIQAQRAGSDVFITLTVPNKNIDSSIPIDIGRVEVYGYTGRTPPPRAQWALVGELVATIPVIPPPLPATSDAPAPPPQPAGDTVENGAASSAPKGAAPGMIVTVLDTLTQEKLVQGRVEPEPVGRRARAPLSALAPVSTANQPEPLHRYYVAFAFSARGRPGPPGTPADFPLVEGPPPPAFVRTTYSESSVFVEWPPSGGLFGYLFDHPMAQEDVPLDASLEPVVPAPAPPPAGAAAAPAGPVRYNVYRQIGGDPLAPPDEVAPTPWSVTRPAPLNPAPLDTTTFTDTLELDRVRCYVVRALRGVPPNAIEGDASEPACATFTDVFPPAAPVRLVAVADEGGISLIWEPNSEADVAGYLVLRGDPSDATLQPLTPTPVVEPRFRDTHVAAGKKYVYAVVAVDAHLPLPNMSAESMHVEETAR